MDFKALTLRQQETAKKFSVRKEMAFYLQILHAGRSQQSPMINFKAKWACDNQ